MKTPNRSIRWPLAALMVLVTGLAGCATGGLKDVPPDLVQGYRARAAQAEAKGDLRQALLDWQVVTALTPQDQEASAKVASVRVATEKKAEAVFKRGVELLDKGRPEDAQRVLILALYLNPTHARALTYLKAQMGGRDRTLHSVKKGETLASVTESVYGDKKKSAFLAAINGLDPAAALRPGTVLAIPSLEGLVDTKGTVVAKKKGSTPSAPLEEPPVYDDEAAWRLASLNTRDVEEISREESLVEQMLDEARQSLNANRFQDAAVGAGKVLEIEPGNHEARQVVNAAHYHLGKGFMSSRQYEKALKSLDRVDSGYEDTAVLMGNCRDNLAEIHYLNGVKDFTDDKLEDAANEFETALGFNPDHAKARRDLDQVRGLMEKLKRFK